MKVTRKFIEGFVEGCYEHGLTEKQASWLLDRYIEEGNGEILEKSAAGKSILNLLLLLLALGGGAYGLDRLGGTNTALGKWLKDNLGAGSWGIKDALEGLFSPAANAATTAATVPAPATNPAPTVEQNGANNTDTPPSNPPASTETTTDNSTSAAESTGATATNTAGKPQEGTTISPEQAEAIARGQEVGNQVGNWIKDKAKTHGQGIADMVRRLPRYAVNKAVSEGYTQQPIINMAGKPTQITATPPTPNVSIAPLPEAQSPEATWPDLNLTNVPEAEPTGDDTSTSADLNTPQTQREYAIARGQEVSKQVGKLLKDNVIDYLPAITGKAKSMAAFAADPDKMQSLIERSSKRPANSPVAPANPTNNVDPRKHLAPGSMMNTLNSFIRNAPAGMTY